MPLRSKSLCSIRMIAVGLIASSIVTGCGGSDDDNSNSGSNTNGSATAATGVDIAWAARSRDVEAPGSALSAVVTFVGGSSTGTDVAFTVNRRSDPAAYTSTYGTPTRIKIGGVTLRVTFYAGANGTGARVGDAETSAILKTDGTLSRADGRPLGTVSTSGTIASITATSPVSVAVGATVQLAVTALDASGNVVAVSAGSATFSGSSSVLSVTPAGVVTGLATGSGTVTATLDGRTATVTVNVVRAANAAILEIDQPVNEIVYSAAQNRIYATTSNTASNANRFIGIVPSSGAIDQSIQIGSNPGPLALSRDGNVAYVGLTGSGTVRRVDLATNAVGAPISLGVDEGFSGGQRFAEELAVSPTDASTFAVYTRSNGFGFGRRIALFRNGVEVATNGSNQATEAPSLAFGSTGDRIYGFNNQSSSYDLVTLTIDGSTLTPGQPSYGAITGFQTEIVEDSGRIYGGDGRVVSAATLTRIGEFSGVNTNGAPFALDAAARRIYFFSASTSEDSRILVFDIDTFDRVETKTLAGVSPAASNSPGFLTLAGANRLALATPDGKIYLIDLARL